MTSEGEKQTTCELALLSSALGINSKHKLLPASSYRGVPWFLYDSLGVCPFLLYPAQ